MLEKSWLRGMLTNAKKRSQMWLDLVDAITETLNAFPERFLDRLKTRTSLFEQGPRELEVELRELGDFFAYGDITDENLPFIIMQRQDEIHMKQTTYPLISTLQREFAGLNVTWEPLFAPKNQLEYPYGELFIIKSQFGDQTGFERKDFFLTSRGVIRVPLNEVRNNSSNNNMEEFEAQLNRVIYPLIPLHRVCDGPLYFLQFELQEATELLNVASTTTKDYVALTEKEESLNFQIHQKENMELQEELRSPAPARMRIGAIGLDALRLDFDDFEKP